MIKEIWFIEMLRIVGFICFIMCIVLVLWKLMCGRISMLIFFRCGSWYISCRMLLIVIVYVSVSIGGLKYGVVNSVKLIMLMLSSVGVNVGIEKWFYVFRIVFISDVREISKI